MKFNRRSFVQKMGAGMLLLSRERSPEPVPVHSAKVNEPVRTGLIGAGARGKWLAKIASTLPAFEITACCDLLPGHREACSREIGKNIAFYDDYRKLIAAREVQAVIIATPLFLHFDMAQEALKAGKHVYCEKTMTHTRRQAADLKKLAAASPDRVFQVGYQHRFNPIYSEIKFLIDQGYCGRISRVECTWNRNGNWRRPLPENTGFKGNTDYPDLEHLINWRMYQRYSGGLVAELCSHQMDILLWLLDDRPGWIMGTGGIDYWKDGRETYDNVHLLAGYTKGVKASFTALTGNALQGYSIKILGDKGSIEVTGEDGHRAKIYAENIETEQQADGVTAATKLAWENDEGVPVRVKNPARDDVLPTEGALQHFVQCIGERKQPVSNAETAYISSVTADLANEAIAKGEKIYWKE